MINPFSCRSAWCGDPPGKTRRNVVATHFVFEGNEFDRQRMRHRCGLQRNRPQNSPWVFGTLAACRAIQQFARVAGQTESRPLVIFGSPALPSPVRRQLIHCAILARIIGEFDPLQSGTARLAYCASTCAYPKRTQRDLPLKPFALQIRRGTARRGKRHQYSLHRSESSFTRPP